MAKPTTKRPRGMGALYLTKGLLDAAVDAYGESARQYPQSPAPLYFNLLAYLQEQVKLIAQFRQDIAANRMRPAMLISVPVWGQKYIANMGNFLIRSLLAPENLPSVAKERQVFFEFSTRASDAASLDASPAVRDLRRHAAVKIVRYPDHLFASHPAAPDFNYRLFGAMHHMAILRAQAMGNMDVVLLCADHICSDGAFGQVNAYLNEGYKMIVSAGMRIDKKRWVPALLTDLNAEGVDDYIAIRPGRLVDYAVRYMHPVTQRLVVSRRTRPFGALPFPLYFANEGGVSAHSFILHPVAVSAELVQREISYDFNTVDGAFLSRVLLGYDYEEVVAILGRRDEAYIFEVSEPDNLQENQVVPFFNMQAIAKYFFQWRAGDVEEVYRWFFEQPIWFRAESEAIRVYTDDIDEKDAVEGVLNVIREWEVPRGDEVAAATVG